MKPKTVEKLAWVLIYSGLLMLSLGLFVLRGAATLGWGLVIAGTLDALAGAALVVVRSRMPDPSTPPEEMP